DLGNETLMRLEVAMEAAQRHLLVALEPERLPSGPLLEYQWDHAHADQVGAMDAFERLRNHGAHAEQERALCRPVARGADAIFLAGEYDQRHVLTLVAHRRIVDRHALAGWIVDRVAAFDSGHHLVLEPDVGEGAAHHHLVIAAARAVLIEIERLD